MEVLDEEVGLGQGGSLIMDGDGVVEGGEMNGEGMGGEGRRLVEKMKGGEYVGQD
ncbi:hypothetical protein [Staphylococcus warneri]|uniref:hypothetical protein n=1 Tax=Staphylococcus warneri TaxID=1292 RepID=UPI001642C3DE|nr:hypothetical protein [Staphylococcus warneri]